MPVQGAPANPSIYQHFSPHRVGLPNLFAYAKLAWERREFAAEMSRARLRSENTNTFFGQAWLLLNPLLQAAVYFLMVMLIRGGLEDPAAAKARIGHLTVGLFLFTMFQTAVQSGSKSVTTAGKVLLNTNFPRLLIPLSAVRSAFFKFLPTIPLYLVINLVIGGHFSWHMITALYFVGCMLAFSMGLSALVATMTVYFRDTASFLPFILRLWMYMSPILWSASELKGKPRFLQAAVEGNPTYGMISGYSNLMQQGIWPPTSTWITAAGWALAAVVIGFLFFISRERDFAVRVL